MSEIVYFSKMFQAVPHLAQVAKELPGAFVSNRRSTLKATRKLYPNMDTFRYSRWWKNFSVGGKLLQGADVIVTGSTYKSFLKTFTAKKCMVFHGTYMLLGKDACMDNEHFDLLCVTGPRMKQMLGRFNGKEKPKAVDTGYLPFCEYPEQSVFQREEALLKLGLSPDKKTIIYTPSRRGIGSWNLVSENLVKKISPEFNLVLRPHPSQALTPRMKDRKSFCRIKGLAKKRPDTIVDLTSNPLSTLLSIADLLISDANSPAEESLFYDVPQFFIETPTFSRDTVIQKGREQKLHRDDLDRLVMLYDCGPAEFIHDEDHDLSGLIENALSLGSSFRHQRANYFTWVFGSRDRDANKRVAQAIKNTLI